jgi:ornithine cyclodeaminase
MKNLKLLFLSMEDVIDLGGLDMKKAIYDIENAMSLYEKGECLLPSKVVMEWGEKKRINAMPGYINGEYDMAGIKWIGSNPENPVKYNLPRASALIILNDPETKIPLAVMDGTVVSAMRTGAVTGVAAKYLSREDCENLLLIGAGVQNRTQLKAIMAVRPSIKKVSVYDIYYEKSQKFAEEMSKEENIEIIPVKAPEQAVANADIFITATVTLEPIVREEWVKPGVFYSQVSGYEATYNAVKRFDKIVVDVWEKVKDRMSSTLALMAADGQLSDHDIYAELGEIVNGAKKGRINNNESVYFNSVGMGTGDLAIATRIYREALKTNRGVELKLWDTPLYV